MNIKLRSATAEDSAGILAARSAAIHELCAGDYDAAQLDSWVSRLDEENCQRTIAAEVCLVADGGTGVVGFAEMNVAEGAIKGIYVHPRHARLGLGTMLLQALESRARSAGIRELIAQSSLTAVPFFRRFGFATDPEANAGLSDAAEVPAVSMRRAF